VSSSRRKEEVVLIAVCHIDDNAVLQVRWITWIKEGVKRFGITDLGRLRLQNLV
jgi:hypothetical protein